MGVDPSPANARRQALRHFVAKTRWADAQALRRASTATARRRSSHCGPTANCVLPSAASEPSPEIVRLHFVTSPSFRSSNVVKTIADGSSISKQGAVERLVEFFGSVLERTGETS